ncbi:MAG: Fe(3+) ABC transporter substrate-binding protein [Rhodobacterales bacterium]|nr:Fe(3+) ABC transporter substrate-binding protein [Rhodobacterales bacterium]NCT12612.1 Fe(3+) ABC transporter substrate-binding protein [Rhodobacterales bacterium]
MRKSLLTAVAIFATTPALADVNIYTTRQPELIAPVMAAFTAQTGIAVNLAFVESGLVERLKAEGRRSPADLVMTVDIANLHQIVAADVLQPVDSAILTAAVPADLRSADGLWFALTSRARVVYAHADRVAPGEVTTYEDLASEKWRGRICTRSGVHNYNLALLSAYIAHHGEEAARDWAAGLRANLARRPEGNERAQARAVWAGECDIAIGNTYYIGQMTADPEQQDWAAALRVEFPTFETGGTHINVSGVAMTRAAPNRAEALRLMEFLVSPEAQAIYAESNFEYPVLAGAALAPIVAGWGDFTPDSIDLTEVAGHRAAALRIMEEVNYDG